MGVGNHVSECAQVVLLQHALDGGKYAGDFLAAFDNLFVGQIIGVFRFAHARDGNLATLQPVYVGRILGGVDQVVLAAPHETEEIKQKLADIGRTHKVVQV